MEKATILVKGNIYCSDFASVKYFDSIIEKCSVDNFKGDIEAEIEGDLHIKSLVVYGPHLRVIATGDVLMNVKPESASWGQAFDGTKELYKAGYISAEGNSQDKEG